MNMHFTSTQLLAVAALISRAVLPVVAQDFDVYKFNLYAREAYDSLDLDFDDLVLLDARDKTWLEQGFEVAKTAIPFAAGHVNLPEAKHSLALGVAGKILENTPTLEQLAAQKAGQHSLTGQQRVHELMDQDNKAKQAQKAQVQSQLHAVAQAGRESQAATNREMAANRERNAHPVLNSLPKKIKARQLLFRRMIEEMIEDA